MVQDNSEGLVKTGNCPGQTLPSFPDLDGLSDISNDELIISQPTAATTEPRVTATERDNDKADKGGKSGEEDKKKFIPVRIKVEKQEEADTSVMNRIPPPAPTFSGGGKQLIISNKNKTINGAHGKDLKDSNDTVSPSKLPVKITGFTTGVEYKMARKLSNESPANQDKNSQRRSRDRRSERPRHKSSSKGHNSEQNNNNDSQKPCSSKSLQKPQETSSPSINLPFVMSSLEDLLHVVPDVTSPTVMGKDGNSDNHNRSNESSRRKIPKVQTASPPAAAAASNRHLRPQKVTVRRKSNGFSDEQLNALRAVFIVNDKPNALDYLDLVSVTELTRQQISAWFKKERQKQRNRDPLLEEVAQLEQSIGQVAQDNAEHIYQHIPAAQVDVLSHQQGHTKRIVEHSATNQLEQDRTQQFNRYTIPKKRKAHDVVQPSSKSAKLQNLEKREKRMRLASSVHIQSLKECLDANKSRVQTLILMYTKKSLDMKKTLLKETARLRETSTKCSPFSHDQLKEMNHWRKEYFKSISANASEDKKEKLQCVQVSVIDVWHPIIVYGKLTGVKLEMAIEDFLVRSSRGIVDSTDGYTVPGILRYIEAHGL